MYFLLALSGWIGTLGAADSFRLIKGFEEIAERGKVPSYIILTESNRFSFLPPPGWNLSHNAAERKVTMVSQDLGAGLLEYQFGRLRAAVPSPSGEKAG